MQSPTLMHKPLEKPGQFEKAGQQRSHCIWQQHRVQERERNGHQHQLWVDKIGCNSLQAYQMVAAGPKKKTTSQ